MSADAGVPLERDNDNTAASCDKAPAPKSLVFFRDEGRHPPRAALTEATPNEAAESSEARSEDITAQGPSTGLAFRTNFFSSLVLKNDNARSRAADERLVGAQQVADAQWDREVAAADEDARGAVSQLQPGRRDTLVDSKLRHEYNFDSDLVRDCSVEEHQALDSEITALHAKGRLHYGLDVAGIVAAAADDALSASSPEAVGIDGRPLANYIEVERASLIDSLHSSFSSPSSWSETAGGEGTGIKCDKAASYSRPKGKTRGSLLFEMTESQLQAAAVTKAQRERHLINSATDMVAKEDWVRSAMEWPEHQCVGFTKEKARPDYGQTKTPVAESRRYTIAGADNDALDKELPPRAAPLQTAPGHLDVNNMALDGKAGGTATRPAPHRIGSDPLPQPRRSDTSQSLGRNKGAHGQAACRFCRGPQRLPAACLVFLLALCVGLDLLVTDMSDLAGAAAAGTGGGEPARVTIRLTQPLPSALRAAWRAGPAYPAAPTPSAWHDNVVKHPEGAGSSRRVWAAGRIDRRLGASSR
eukprot:jgi/Tetstr1/449337/TSEL_003851.t1